MSEKILEAKNLFKTFSLESGFFSKKDKSVYAVNDVSFALNRGETYGIVGESGCGKTTTARLLIRMYEATSGQVLYYPSAQNEEALDVSALKKKELNYFREKVKYIFQDPARSMNPRMDVFSVLVDAFKYSSRRLSRPQMIELAGKTLHEVGLAESDLWRRPSEFSGGQRQRISIARSLIMEPEVLICDEIVSALDVSIQGQILNLLQEIREEKKLSFVFITHDLKVACYFADRIGVMYRGVLVEEAAAATLYKDALHPYTRLLFEGAAGRRSESNVEVKSTLAKETGCPFAHRCPYAKEKCFAELPAFKEMKEGQKVRCHFV